MVLNLTNPQSFTDRICLAKLTPSGELAWKKCYTTADTSQRGEDTFDIIYTPDNGFLITGFCFYEDPEIPNRWIPHPYLLKVDSSGNFLWETVVFKETNQDGGVAWNTVVNHDNKFYYSSISHYDYGRSLASPALVKSDMEGNIIGVYDVIDGYKFGKLYHSHFLTDSTLAGTAGWSNEHDSTGYRAVIIDTLGNLINSIKILPHLYNSILQITFDNKLLYASDQLVNDQFDVYLAKLNQNLEDDTIYTMPFTYDSLCPYAIASDTIVQDDCGLIVGIEEEEEQGGMEAWGLGGVVVWPNPVRGMLNVECLMLNEGASYSLEIYDIFGRKAPGHIVSLPPGGGKLARPLAGAGDRGWQGRQGWQINVSTLPPGIYIAVVRDEGSLIGSAKFVVAR